MPASPVQSPEPPPADAFAAIAEPRRRRLIDLLARQGPTPAGDLVDAMQIPQPSVSKHLAILREVGLVRVERRGRQRIYELNGPALKPVYDWVAALEQHWTTHLDRIKQRAERRANRASRGSPHTKE
ncbi:MAG: metalloregulator ArsR/SmtB family transcription factor [Planctomycetota bacterium]|nr:metalloregulator ArsR/SmtB family transcription factor [Planctomycetota bacterium]